VKHAIDGKARANLGGSMSVTWFPCFLQPVSLIKFARWNVRPGLRAGPMSANKKKMWLHSFSSTPFKEAFEPNFLVEVDGRSFTNGLIKRLVVQGYDKQKLLSGIPKDHHDDVVRSPDDLFRWVLMTPSLCRTFNIAMPVVRYVFQPGALPGQLIPSGCVATHAGHDRSIYTQVPHHPKAAGPLHVNTLNKIARAIEPYYQPLILQTDPVSVALGCFWAFLFSRFPDQAYTSLVTILEALLSTGTAEITHQISERAAVLVGRTPSDRLQLYKKVKKELYALRSRITHGDLQVKKGPITWGSTIITARMTIVSIPLLTEMAQCATAVLRAVLESKEIMSAMDKKQEKRKQKLDEFFLTRLFS
jgi:Apea-like HEPN